MVAGPRLFQARSVGAALLFALAFIAVSSPIASARPLLSSEEGSLALRTSLKAAGLFSSKPEGISGPSSRGASEGLWRARFELEGRAGMWATAVVAYEHRWRAASSAAGGNLAASVPTGAVAAPFRVTQLDWALTEPPGVLWRHEIDRATVSLHGARTELSLGRQAIGWGRGIRFGAVDLFAPFSPLEPDREWRRGVDAARADLRLGARTSLETVAAFGTRISESAFAARLRGYGGEVDGEFLAGRRREDWFVGASASGVAGGAEWHGEAAAFLLPDPVPGEGQVVWKAVAGASYQFRAGNGLPLFAEYCYSGFGNAEANDVSTQAGSATLASMYLRGEAQVMSRHTVAAWTAYQFNPEWTAGGTVMAAPQDGSGIVEPSITLQTGDRLSFRASLYLSFGAGMRGAVPQSFYGATARLVWIQLSYSD